jgi:hypothetical protein
LAEADGNRTRLAGWPGHNGFEDRARHQTRNASTVTVVAQAPRPAERLLGLFHTVTGLWLMYLVFATVLNISAGHDLPAA